jgi:hypothetical protein
MDIEVKSSKWVSTLQDYISQLKNCVIAVKPEGTFEPRQSSVGNPYDDEKLKKMEDIKKYIEGNSWVQEIILNFLSTAPQIIQDYRALKRQEKLYSCDLLGGLIANAFKATLNIWSVYEKSCSILAEADRSKSYFGKFIDSQVVDFVKIAQALLLICPTTAKLGKRIPRIIKANFPTLLKSVESDKFYTTFEMKMSRFGEYWQSQIRRDLMNQRTGIPDPILNDRIKEAKNHMELLHFYKMVFYLSDESKMVKSAFWKTKFLFRDYLFGDNLQAFVHAERSFQSLGILCKNAGKLKNSESENSREYHQLVNALFESVVDLFDVTFYKLLEIHSSMIKKTKKENDGTRGFLKQQNFEDFLLTLGHVVVKGAETNKMSRDDCKNIRFFKLLLYYSEGFREFVKKMSKSLSTDVNMSSQMLVIFNQMIGEVMAFTEKNKEMREYNEKKRQEQAKVSKKTVIKPSKETIEREEKRQKTIFQEQEEMDKFLKVKPTSEAIIFSNEQDEEGGYRNRLKMNKKLDKKTESYLEYIKQYQYNDEFDDSLEFGAKAKNANRKRRNKRNQKTINMEAEKIDEVNEDDLEDEDPSLSKNARESYRDERGGNRHSGRRGGKGGYNDRDDRDQMEQRGSRGRGGFNRRGRRGNHRGGYEGRQRNNRNKREYYNKNR